MHMNQIRHTGQYSANAQLIKIECRWNALLEFGFGWNCFQAFQYKTITAFFKQNNQTSQGMAQTKFD